LTSVIIFILKDERGFAKNDHSIEDTERAH
jgi:hypothetical protein